MLISKGRLKIFAEETQKAEDFLSTASPPVKNTSSMSNGTSKMDDGNGQKSTDENSRPPLPA
jgi:hypothetical protein